MKNSFNGSRWRVILSTHQSTDSRVQVAVDVREKIHDLRHCQLLADPRSPCLIFFKKMNNQGLNCRNARVMAEWIDGWTYMQISRTLISEFSS